jgi:hypothetical protein
MREDSSLDAALGCCAALCCTPQTVRQGDSERSRESVTGAGDGRPAQAGRWDRPEKRWSGAEGSEPRQWLALSEDRLSLTPEQRRLRASIAAHVQWSREPDPSVRTATARRAFMDRFDREVDPDGTLDPAERARRAEHARKAYFAQLALKSSKARAARKQGGGQDAA